MVVAILLTLLCWCGWDFALWSYFDNCCVTIKGQIRCYTTLAFREKTFNPSSNVLTDHLPVEKLKHQISHRELQRRNLHFECAYFPWTKFHMQNSGEYKFLCILDGACSCEWIWSSHHCAIRVYHTHQTVQVGCWLVHSHLSFLFQSISNFFVNGKEPWFFFYLLSFFFQFCDVAKWLKIGK